MQQPTRLISTPFAQEGEKTEIQNVTGEFDNSATYRLGFPPLTMQSIRLGGKPPKGTDFNGVLFDITENISFLCKGGRYQYNAGLSTLIGGYPEGSNLLLDDNVTEVVSTVAGNQNNPNIDMTGWILKPNKTTAVNVADASGETQQQVNYNGGIKWYSRVGGYQENERVVLANGDIVKSTVDGNTNAPNVDMTGWVNSNSASQIFDESGKNQQEINDMIGADWYEKPSGYNVGNRVSKNGFVYQSLENSNSTDPTTDISKWALVNTLSVNSIAQLRKVNPVVPNSIIHLRGLTESSHLGGGEWFYDANDSTSADNGWFIVVTTSGKRLKRVGLDKKFNLDWAGVLNGADISAKWQEAINYIHNKIKAVNNQWNTPSITSSGGEFLLNNPIVKPPYVCTNFTASVHLKADNIADSTHEAVITIYCDDAVNYYENNRSPQFPKTLSCTRGKIRLSRSGTRALTNPIALYTKGATVTAHAINMKVSDLEVSGAFKAGHGNKAERTWLMRFENCVFNGFYGIAYLGGTNIDSGERISYVNCVASGGYNNPDTKAIYLESPGININFEGSIDFTGGDVVYLASSATWVNLTFVNSHIESWNGYLVNFETPSSSQARFVSFKSTNFLPNGSLGIAQSLSRKLINGSGGTVLFDDSFISWTAYPYDSFNSILTDTSTGIKVRVKNHRNLDLGLHPFSARSYLLKTMNFSAEADGATITSTGATATTIRVLRSLMSGVTATIKALDNSLIDTSLPAGTTNVIKAVLGSSAYAYFESVEKIRVQPGREYGMKATAIMPDLNSNLRIAPAIAWYDESDTYISRSEVYYSDMKAIVNASINGVPAYGSRADKRVSCRTNPLVAPVGASYGRAAFQLTNGTTGATYYITDYNLFDSPTN